MAAKPVKKGKRPVSKKKKSMASERMANEILLLLCMIVSILAIISLFSTRMGLMGSFFQSVLKGFFGIGGYFLPFFAMIVCIAVVQRREADVIFHKAMAAALGLLGISILFYLLGGRNVQQANAMALYQAGAASNGGVVGGIAGRLMIGVFGRPGALLVDFAILLIAVMLVMELSFFEGIRGILLFFGRFKTVRVPAVEKTATIDEPPSPPPIKRAKKKQGLEVFNFQLEPAGESVIEKDAGFPFEAEAIVKNREVDFSENTAMKETVASEQPEDNIQIHSFEEQKAARMQQNYENSWENITEEKNIDPAASSSETSVEQEIFQNHTEKKEYRFPPLSLLTKGSAPAGAENSKMQMIENAKKLEDCLLSFGVQAKVLQINRGPTVTRYELAPNQGVKVSRIVSLADDIALNLAANGIRMEAPIPGKSAVGIEVPNQNSQPVFLRDVLSAPEFQEFPSKLAFALGEDIAGNPVVTDIDKMPHLLIAGATGSGKSVCINTLITSILFKARPDEVKLLLVDPKVVELSVYNGIPHLLIPVVTDPKKAAGALNWAVREMLSRYQRFAEQNVRDIKGYNQKILAAGEEEQLPQIVIIIDELADLMMAAPGEVEDSICRLAQMARAAGLHLVIATQRPSVDVITGVIKANVPSRLAFAVSSGTDSRTILDSVGAEKLLGKGDMLFSPVGLNKPQRIQGAFISDKEVEQIVEYVKGEEEGVYDEQMIEHITSNPKNTEMDQDSDEFLEQAIQLVIEKQKASVSMLQRQFRIGYNRAARLMDDLEARGIVGKEDGSKPRKVLLSEASYIQNQNKSNEEETE